MLWLGYLLIAQSVAYIATAVWLVGRTRRQTKLVRLMSLGIAFTGLFALSMGMVYVRAARGLDPDLFYRMSWVGWLLMPPTLSLCYHLRGRPRQAKWLEAIMYAIWGTILVLCLTTDLVETGIESVYPFVDRPGPFEKPARGLAAICLVGCGWALYRTRQETRGIERQRTSYFLLGLSLYTASAMVGAVTAQIVGIAFDPGLTVIFSVPWVILTLYAMTRHRMFDVNMLASRIATGSVLAAVSTGCAALVFWQLKDSLGPMGAMLLGGLSGATLLIVSPLSRAVANGVSRLTGTRRDSLRNVSKTLNTVLSLDELLNKIVAMVRDNLGVTKATVFLRHSGGGLRLAQNTGPPGSVPADISDRGPLLGWIAEKHLIYIREEQAMLLEESEQTEIEREIAPFGAEVVVPITHVGRITGLLMLGPKENHDAFLQADIELLENLSAQASLAIQNAQLYAALNDTKVDLDEFVRAAAHDLRSPLRGIDLLAEFAQEDMTGEANSAVSEHLDKLRGRVRRMETLLDAVEAYVRAGHEELQLEQINVPELVTRVVSQLEVPPGFRIETRSDLKPFRTARSALEEVLRQLIENSIVHADSDEGHIMVTTKPRGDTVVFSIEDNGPGIPEAFLERIFEPFSTLVRRDVKEGRGMGLALCRKLVHRGGGRLWATRPKNKKDRGTIFHFAWPLRWSAIPAASVWSLAGRQSDLPAEAAWLRENTAEEG